MTKKLLFIIGLISCMGHAGHPADMSQRHMLNEAILTGSIGLLQGVGQQVGKPVGAAVGDIFSVLFHPVRTFNKLQLSIFQHNNPAALTFEQVVRMQQEIDQVIKNLLIDPANASNRVLRRALAQPGTQEEASNDEYIFAISMVRAHLEHMSALFVEAHTFYEKELVRSTHEVLYAVGGGALGAGAQAGSIVYNAPEKLTLQDFKEKKSTLFMSALVGSVAGYVTGSLVGKPYSREEINQILFAVERIQDHIQFLASMTAEFKELAQINEKKDSISMIVKNLIGEMAHLCFLLEPSRAFDPHYKGLKLIYEATKMVADRQAVKPEAAA